jgi:predicted transcriptional regulator
VFLVCGFLRSGRPKAYCRAFFVSGVIMDRLEVEQLRLERLRLRITQVELFARTGISPSRISQVENRLLEPKPDELARWREALGMNGNGATDQ